MEYGLLSELPKGTSERTISSKTYQEMSKKDKLQMLNYSTWLQPENIVAGDVIAVRTSKKRWHTRSHTKRRSDSLYKRFDSDDSSDTYKSRKGRDQSGVISQDRIHRFITKLGIKESDFKKATKKIFKGQLGRVGKDGITVLYKDGKHSYALKIFKRTKSAAKVRDEINFQKKAAKQSLSPPIYQSYEGTRKNNVRTSKRNPFILMKLLHRTLPEMIKKQDGRLTTKQQEQMIKIFEKLDRLQILHNDSNPSNFMFSKHGTLYIIDFGLSRKFNQKERAIRNNQPKPNITVSLMGLYERIRKYRPKQLRDYLKKHNKKGFCKIFHRDC